MKLHDSYFDRKLKCGDILDYSAEFFRRNLKKLVAMTLFFHVPIMFVIYFCMNMSSMGSELLGDYIVNGSVMMAIVPLLMFYTGAMLMSVYNLTFYNALSAAVVKFTYESVVNNNTMRPGKAILFGLKKFGWLVLYMLLAEVVLSAAVMVVYFLLLFLIMGAAVLCAELEGAALNAVMIGMAIAFLTVLLAMVCVIIYFTYRLLFIPQAIAVENCNCITAIKRSFKVTKKRFWRTFKPAFWGMILANMASGGVSGLFSILSINGNIATRVLSGAANAAAAVLTPFTVIVSTILYINYKKQDGDIDFELRMNEKQCEFSAGLKASEDAPARAEG